MYRSDQYFRSKLRETILDDERTKGSDHVYFDIDKKPFVEGTIHIKGEVTSRDEKELVGSIIGNKTKGLFRVKNELQIMQI